MSKIILELALKTLLAILLLAPVLMFILPEPPTLQLWIFSVFLAVIMSYFWKWVLRFDWMSKENE